MSKEVAGFILIVNILVAITLKDIKYHVIPNKWVMVFGTIGAILRLSLKEINYIEIVFDGVIVAIIMLCVTLIVKDAFGGGDIKLMIASGVLLGYRKNIEAFIIAMILALVIGLLQVVFKKKNFRDRIPLAPGISVGIILCYINIYLIK